MADNLSFRIRVLSEGIQVALHKGLSANECYAILKSGGYSDEELYLAFLQVAGVNHGR